MSSLVDAPTEDHLDERAFRAALGLFASGVTVVATIDPQGSIHGMTATAFSSLSLRPPLVLVAVSRGSRCHRLVTAQRRFGISILANHQQDLARHFGGMPSATAAPAFEDLGGLPVLAEAIVTLACTLEHVADGGDHSIFIGRVHATRKMVGEPLVHFAGRYRTLSKDTVEAASIGAPSG